MHLVSLLGEQPDRLAEVAQVAGVEEREDELQAGGGCFLHDVCRNCDFRRLLHERSLAPGLAHTVC